MQHFNIGQAAAAAGVTPKMARNYESLGLIPAADRTEAGYRLYGEREIAMLRFVRQARSVGFPMQQIQALMALWRDPGRRSHDVKQLAHRQLQELVERQRELDQMRAALERMVGQCRGDQGPDCVILEQLASAASTPVPHPSPTRALKQRKPGNKSAPARRAPARAAAEPAARPHEALAAWARTLVRSGSAPNT